MTTRLPRGAILLNTTDPATPASGQLALYPKSDQLYTKTSGGLVRKIAAGNGIPEVLLRETSELEVVNTTAVTTIASVTIPANAMGTDRAVELELFGDYLNNSGAARTFDVTVALGSTTVYQDATQSLSTASIRRALYIRLLIQNRGTTATNHGGGVFNLGFASGSSTIGGGDLGTSGFIYNPILFATSTVDTTVDNLFKISIAHSVAHANLSLKKFFSKAVLL